MRWTRRTFLGTTVATLPLALAGCLGGDGASESPTPSPDAGSGSSPTATETETETETQTRTQSATETGPDTDTPTPANATETATETGMGTETDEEAADVTVQTRTHPDHGNILVGPDGMTLYMFDQDTEGEGMSACYEGCAETWPPLTVDATPTAGNGVTAELTTFEREDGSMQVAAAGWPLYYFAPDQEPGDANGQGANDVWWVLAPDGTPIRVEQETTTSGGY